MHIRGRLGSGDRGDLEIGHFGFDTGRENSEGKLYSRLINGERGGYLGTRCGAVI